MMVNNIKIGIVIVLFLQIISCKNNEHSEKSYLAKADTLIKMNQIDSAYKILTPLRHSNNDTIAIQANIKICKLYELTKEYKNAVTLYRDIIADYNIDSLNERMGYCYYKLDIKDSALYYFNKSLSLGYSSISYFYIGVINEEEKNIVSAKSYYKLSIFNNKLKHLSYNNLGEIYYLNQQFDSAKYMFDQAIKSDPAFAEGYYNLAVFNANNGAYPIAIKLINKSLELDYVNPIFLFEKGEIYNFSSNQDSACFYYNKAIKHGYNKPIKYLNKYCK